MTAKWCGSGSFCSHDHLIDAITLWADHWNQNPKPFVWRAPAEEILDKVTRGRQALKNTHANSVSDR